MANLAPPAHPCDWSMYHVVSLESHGNVITERVSEPKVIKTKKTFFQARDEYVRQFGVEADRVRGCMIEGTEQPPKTAAGYDSWAWTGNGSEESAPFEANTKVSRKEKCSTPAKKKNGR